MATIAPCKGCTDRSPACHDRCEAYKQWSASQREEKEWNRAKNRENYEISTHHFSTSAPSGIRRHYNKSKKYGYRY